MISSSEPTPSTEPESPVELLRKDYLASPNRISQEGPNDTLTAFVEEIEAAWFMRWEGVQDPQQPKGPMNAVMALASQHSVSTYQMLTSTAETLLSIDMLIFQSMAEVHILLVLKSTCIILRIIQLEKTNERDWNDQERSCWCSMLRTASHWLPPIWKAYLSMPDTFRTESDLWDQYFSSLKLSLLLLAQIAGDDTSSVLCPQDVRTFLMQKSPATDMLLSGALQARSRESVEEWYHNMHIYGHKGDLMPYRLAWSPEVRAPAIARWVQRYGVAAIVRCFIVVMSDVQGDHGMLITGQYICSELLRDLKHYKDDATPILNSLGALSAVARNLWALLRNAIDGSHHKSFFLLCFPNICQVVQYASYASILHSIVLDDLLSMVARLGCFMAKKNEEFFRNEGLTTSSNKGFRLLTQRVCLALKQGSAPTDMLVPARNKLVPIFLGTLDALRSLDQLPIVSQVISCWIDIGHAANLDERAMRTAMREGANAQLIGCSWHRCALFDLRTHIQFLLCGRCGKTQYCSVKPCQKRDWYEGGHKLVCKAR